MLPQKGLEPPTSVWGVGGSKAARMQALHCVAAHLGAVCINPFSPGPFLRRTSDVLFWTDLDVLSPAQQYRVLTALIKDLNTNTPLSCPSCGTYLTCGRVPSCLTCDTVLSCDRGMLCDTEGSCSSARAERVWCVFSSKDPRAFTRVIPDLWDSIKYRVVLVSLDIPFSPRSVEIHAVRMQRRQQSVLRALQSLRVPL